MKHDNASTLDRSRLLAIGWAVFLGMSWTWCIGMYLPVLMVRDFGVAGWFVFMTPNVIGAAAMGWFLSRPGAAADLANKHRPAAVAFSLVTILFHAFFVGWIIRSLVGDAAEIITATATVGFYFCGRRGRRDLLTAAVLFGVSLTAFIVAASMPGVLPAGPVAVKPMLGLIYLAPVCIFGFFLCPYLDLTFLRTRSATETKTGIAAFTFGFGIFFLAMLLFTLWYARLLQPGNLHSVPRTLAWIIAGHMMLQTAYTVALHTRAMSEGRRGTQFKETARDFLTPSPGTPGEGWGEGLLQISLKNPHPNPLPAYRERELELAYRKSHVPVTLWKIIATVTLAIVIAFITGAWGDRLLPALFTPEIVYRLFMAFYGLVFPAYVWLCVIQTRRSGAVSSQRKLVVLAFTLLIAAPMFWLGFISDQMFWLVPGLLVVILSRAALQPFAFKITRSAR